MYGIDLEKMIIEKAFMCVLCLTMYFSFHMFNQFDVCSVCKCVQSDLFNLCVSMYTFVFSKLTHACKLIIQLQYENICLYEDLCSSLCISVCLPTSVYTNSPLSLI